MSFTGRIAAAARALNAGQYDEVERIVRALTLRDVPAAVAIERRVTRKRGGTSLERNLRAFQDIQKALQDQSQRMYGDNSRASQELWAQFMNLQGPAMQSLMQAYMEQSQKMFAQFQEQMQSQARNMFSGLSFPGFPTGQNKSDADKS